MEKSKKLIAGISVGVSLFVIFLVWFIGSSNPETNAGYVGYVTQGAVFGKTKFYSLQEGPASPGRTWMVSVRNVSVTPYTYTEDFNGDNSVLSKDNLKVSFSLHIVWKVRKNAVREFIEKYSVMYDDKNPDKLVFDAYKNYIQQPLRTYGRDEVQRLDGMDIKDSITPIGDAIYTRIQKLAKETPFEVSSVVVGNIQYPKEVADAVATKMATTQLLQQKANEIQIEEADKKKRIVQAEGIARAMEIIQAKLTPNYLQHEAIEAQKAMVGSPNHTTIYIPVGAMGVPLVSTTNGNQVPKEEGK
jgi:regulator of protease activity HflC (stomatin/prohibitin superfamily)